MGAGPSRSGDHDYGVMGLQSEGPAERTQGRYDSVSQYARPLQTTEEEEEVAPSGTWCAQGMNFVRSDSMEITNDPRFFQDNVLDKRLLAFKGLGVIASLLTGVVISQIYSMRKDQLLYMNGGLQLGCFFLMSCVLFACVLATYISVAQVYHTYRLFTAGPTGFETASYYYLHKSIVLWRHLAIKCMLVSLPVFLATSGLRMLFKFDMARVPRLGEADHQVAVLPPLIGNVSIPGLVFCLLYNFMGVLLLLIHKQHMKVFRDQYAEVLANEKERPLLMRRHQTSLATLHGHRRVGGLEV